MILKKLTAPALCALLLTGCSFDLPEGLRRAAKWESDPDAVSASAPEEAEPEGLIYLYNIQDGEAVLTDADCTAGDSFPLLNIPAEYADMPVTAIADGGFCNSVPFRSVRIPSSVKQIGSYAFGHCNSLRKADLSGCTLSMGEYCFDDSGLVELVAVQAKLSMQSYCFDDLLYLKTLLFSGDMEVGEYCFENCPALEAVWIADGSIKIGNYAFRQTGMQSLTITGCTGTIGDYCFRDNKSLETVVIGDGITALGAYCFDNCPNLKTVVLPEALRNSIGDSFSGCPDAEFIFTGSPEYEAAAALLPEKPVLSDGIPAEPERPAGADTDTEFLNLGSGEPAGNIPDNSYHDMLALRHVTSGGDVTIGNNCFRNCPVLESVLLSEGNVTIGNGCFTDNSAEHVLIVRCTGTIGSECFTGMDRLSVVTIEEGITEIGAGSFCCCTGLMTVDLPASVTAIGEGCFTDCGNAYICAPKGSYAIEYAREHGLPYTETDRTD